MHARFKREEQLLQHEQRYRGTSLIRNSTPLEPHSKNMPRDLWRPLRGGLFLMSEISQCGGRDGHGLKGSVKARSGFGQTMESAKCTRGSGARDLSDFLGNLGVGF